MFTLLFLGKVWGEGCTQIEKCNTCKKPPPMCNRCETGYGVDPDGKCHACSTGEGSSANCASCSAKSDGTIVCESCIADYGLKGDKSGCTSCKSIDSCAECKDSNNDGTPECTKCDLGKKPKADGSSCIACPFETCEDCNLNESGEATTCIKCQDGRILMTDNTCKPCTESIGNCAMCKYASEAVTCTQCDSGYGLSSDGMTCLSCTALHASCTNCVDDDDDGSADTCTACENGLALKSGVCSSCSKEMANCAECSSAKVCTKCADGFGVKEAGAGCFACGEHTGDNCVSCVKKPFECSECAKGHEPTDDKTACAKFCHQCYNTTHCAHHISEDSSVTRCLLKPGTSCWTIRYQFGSEYDYVRDCKPQRCTSSTKLEKCHDTALYRTCQQCCDYHQCNHYLLKDVAPPGQQINLGLCLLCMIAACVQLLE